jgi:hypothetical protein
MIFLFVSLHSQEIQTIHTQYYSPDSTKFISYFGLDRGDGSFYQEIVACADSEYDLVFCSVFDGREVYRYKIKDLELNRMLGRTHIQESDFIDDRYVLKYCLDDLHQLYTHTIKVKIDTE